MMTAHPNDWQQRYHEAVEALAEVWTEGYTAGRFDSVDSLLGDKPSRTNPYTEEEN